MANIFAKTNDWFDKPKRNTFDLSFQNNLTMKFGALYPCFVKEVVPGDSFSILPTFGLRLMPMMFPIQTRMKANLHFFYVRNRNLWKDWQDFIGHTKEGLVKPYIQPLAIRGITKKTGSIYDYMNLPTTVAGDYGANDVFPVVAVPYSSSWHSWNARYAQFAVGKTFGDIFTNASASTGVRGAVFVTDFQRDQTTVFGDPADITLPFPNAFTQPLKETKLTLYVGNVSASLNSPQATVLVLVKDESDGIWKCCYFCNSTVTRRDDMTDGTVTVSPFEIDFGTSIDSGVAPVDVEYINSCIENYGTEYVIAVASSNFINSFNGATTVYGADSCTFPRSVNINARSTVTADIDDIMPDFYRDTVHIDSLPFRAYESIYNAFYRNQQNDPFMIPHVDPDTNETVYEKEYNKVLTSVEGGADDFNYQLRYRNWELDYLTSALPSPMQGNAPLVGVTSTGVMTFQNEDGTTFNVQAITGEDGESITGIRVMDGTRDAAGNATIRSLVDAVSNGISISDFRNVNSLQRWLEANMRRGFRYIDQIETHYGVKPKYEEMDLPEFLGGVSQPIEINQVSATAQSNGVNIGDYAGQGYCIGTSKHRIEKYCDEHGFIIGIISVSPVPNYSQLIPKMFLKTDALDYFFPEFGHISPQSITYREVCPIQTKIHDLAEGMDTLNDTFGYQRAWYDYISSVDEVHGDFRTTLQSFLMNRVFDSKPILGADFIHINPDHLNDVFADTTDNDKILGQIFFDVKAKRPIPMFGIPRLE